MNSKQWTIFGIMLGAALALTGLGFAAMSTNPPFTVADWLPLVFFVASGLVFIIAITYAINSLRKNKFKLSRQKISELKRIPDTLTLMHQRIKQIREDQAKVDIGFTKAKRVQEQMWYALYPIPKKMLDKIHEWQRTDYSRFIRYMEIYSSVFIGSPYKDRWVNFSCDIGGVLEAENIGLQPVLKMDIEYKPLKDVLDFQCAGVPQGIVKLTVRYERYLYGISSGILWNSYRTKYLGKLLPIAVEAKVPQFERSAEDEIINRVKDDVVKAIKKITKRNSG